MAGMGTPKPPPKPKPPRQDVNLDGFHKLNPEARPRPPKR
jgi:hypothetical protein